MATAQPLLSPPMRLASGTRASVKNTSLKWEPWFICLSGRMSIPGCTVSITKNEMPLCLGLSGSVRTTRIPRSECWAPELHTFWPLTTHSSPSRSAFVCRPARSLPAPGSEKNWHQASAPVARSRIQRAFCSSVPNSMITGAAIVWAWLWGAPRAPARMNSSPTTAATSALSPRP